MAPRLGNGSNKRGVEGVRGKKGRVSRRGGGGGLGEGRKGGRIRGGDREGEMGSKKKCMKGG